MKVYKVTNEGLVTEGEAVRATASHVFFDNGGNEQRQAIVTQFHEWFIDATEANTAAMENAQKAMMKHLRLANKAREALEAAQLRMDSEV